MREMNRSGIPWIGEIPIKWQVGRIKNGYNVTLGKMISSEKADESQTLENYLCAANIKFSGVDTSVSKQMWFSDKEKEQFLLSEGDLLIMEGGMAGTACQYQGEFSPCYIQNSVHRIRRNKIGNNRFLYYWMNVVFNSGYVNDICNKATILHYTKEKVECTPVLYPTVREQEAIVSYLDNACSKIDEAISRHRQIIEKLEEYRKAVITKAVTKGIDPNVEMTGKGDNWIKNIPSHWELKTLGNVAKKFRNGYVGPTKGILVETGVRYIQSLHIKDGNIQYDGVFFVSEEWGEMHPKIHTGDVLIVQTGDIGQVAMVTPDFDGCNCHALIIFTPRNELIDSEYLTYYLRSSYGYQQLLQYETGATLKHLNSGNIRYSKIINPPVLEQKSIVNYLKEKESFIDKSIARYQEAITKLEEYRRSIIYSAVTGKHIVVNGDMFFLPVQTQSLQSKTNIKI